MQNYREDERQFVEQPTKKYGGLRSMIADRLLKEKFSKYCKLSGQCRRLKRKSPDVR